MIYRIRTKFALSFIALVTIMIVIVTTVLYIEYSRLVETQTTASRLSLMRNAVLNLDLVIRNVANLDARVILNDRLLEALENDPPYGSFAFAVNSRAIVDEIENIRYINSIIDSVYVFSTVTNYFYKTQIDRTMTADDIRSTTWYSSAESWPRNHWSQVPSIDGESTHILSIKPILNAARTRKTGYFSINIDEGTIREQLESIDSSGGRQIYIVDRLGFVISHDRKDLIGSRAVTSFDHLSAGESGYFLDERESAQTLVVFVRSELTGWTLVEEIPYAGLMAPIRDARRIGVAVGLVTILVAFVATSLISRSMLHPIGILRNHMNRAGEGDVDSTIEDSRTDEFGILYSSFNRMVADIRQLLDELYTQRILKQELQLKMIQSQLNPHFLYNTLDSIHWAAREHAYDDVCEMTFELSSYFRKALSGGQDIVSVEHVAGLLEAYLKLQSIRFEKKFTFEQSIAPELREARVLKYIFQPIVENAINHGIIAMEGGGTVTIRWSSAGDGSLKFTVEDNGMGIRPDRLAELEERLMDDSSDVSDAFALRNIRQQMRLFYHDRARISIESEPGAWTRVSLIIPTEPTGAAS